MPAKQCFIEHAATWLNPKAVAIGVVEADMDVTYLAASQLTPKPYYGLTQGFSNFFVLLRHFEKIFLCNPIMLHTNDIKT